MSEQRRFLRHPAGIPIEFTPAPGAPRAGARAQDVSMGGLAFEAAACPREGEVVEIRIPSVRPAFRTRGRVVWCRDRDGGYEVGVEFLEAGEAFRARMVEQVCQIERYRRRVHEDEGRQLSADEAAREWIARSAAGFPGAE